jgi:hypothetical protein
MIAFSTADRRSASRRPCVAPAKNGALSRSTVYRTANAVSCTATRAKPIQSGETGSRQKSRTLHRPGGAFAASIVVIPRGYSTRAPGAGTAW